MKQLPNPEQRLKLMHVVDGLGTGGLEKTIVSVCNGLPRGQFATSLCSLTPADGMVGRLDCQRVELIHVHRRFGNDPTLPLRLARELRRRRIDILHTNSWSALVEGIIAAKLAGVRIHVHGEHGKIRNRRRQILAQRWAWRAVDQVVMVSDALADRASNIVGFPRNRIHVINNSADVARFRPSATAKHELRNQFGLPPNAFLVGMVARFVPFKDHAGAVRAVARLCEDGADAHLALAGSGPLEGELRRLADTLDIADHVHFLAELNENEVVHLLQAMDVFVSNSSHNEGMSLSVLEAMACAVPVVSTRVAASPEVLDGGAAGVLIPPQDTESLSLALQQLADDPDTRRALGQAGRQRVVDQYSTRCMVESYRRLYARLASLDDGCPESMAEEMSAAGSSDLH
ncbi:MAG: glycosyltransferase [Pirellulales bacterium]|nr:glycosyltransferase [Pirellulales bacterium]